jgi:hypothetical protein
MGHKGLYDTIGASRVGEVGTGRLLEKSKILA